MILATLFGTIAAAAWVWHSYRQWPELFSLPGELFFAIGIGILWAVAGFFVQIMLEVQP